MGLSRPCWIFVKKLYDGGPAPEEELRVDLLLKSHSGSRPVPFLERSRFHLLRRFPERRQNVD
jgi:hypothetical protein